MGISVPLLEGIQNSPSPAKNIMKILNTFILGGCLAILLADISGGMRTREGDYGCRDTFIKPVCAFATADEYDHDNFCYLPSIFKIYMMRQTETKNYVDNFKAVFEAMKAAKTVLESKDYDDIEMYRTLKAEHRFPKLKGDCMNKQKINSMTKAQKRKRCSEHMRPKILENFWNRDLNTMLMFSDQRTTCVDKIKYQKYFIQDGDMSKKYCSRQWKFCDAIIEEHLAELEDV